MIQPKGGRKFSRDIDLKLRIAFRSETLILGFKFTQKLAKDVRFPRERFELTNQHAVNALICIGVV